MEWRNGWNRLCRRLACLAGCIFLCIGVAQAAGDTAQTAQAQAESQAGVLTGALDGQAAALMEGVTLTDGLDQAAAQLIENLSARGGSAWSAALASLGKMLVVAVLCGAAQGVRAAAGSGEDSAGRDHGGRFGHDRRVPQRPDRHDGAVPGHAARGSRPFPRPCCPSWPGRSR